MSSALAGIALGGCQSPRQTAAEAIEASLLEKYGQEFNVLKIGGAYGTADNTTLKATVAPSADPTLIFEARIKKDDHTDVQDRFVGATVANRWASELSSGFADVVGQDVVVKVQMENPSDIGQEVTQDPGVSAETYFAENGPEFWPAVLIVSGPPLTEPTEAQIRTLSELVARIAPEANVDLVFTSESEFASLQSNRDGMSYEDVWTAVRDAVPTASSSAAVRSGVIMLTPSPW